jgi:hypothetical protein
MNLEQIYIDHAYRLGQRPKLLKLKRDITSPDHRLVGVKWVNKPTVLAGAGQTVLVCEPNDLPKWKERGLLRVRLITHPDPRLANSILVNTSDDLFES